MNIVLIGMRGSGKTTVGKFLSKKTNKIFYDLDKLLIKKNGTSIPEMIKKFDWEYFRNKESEIAEEISNETDVVIATGGGIVLRQKNIDAFKKNSKFIYMRTSIPEMIKRIGEDMNRPALTNKKSLREELKEVLLQRKSLYEQTADIIIDTDNKPPKIIVEEIIRLLNNNGTIQQFNNNIL